MTKSLVEKVYTYNKALSEPQRIKMMKIICSAEKNTVCVSDIARILNISQPAATKHLKILCDSFIQGFKPCRFGYDCDNCPHKETCA